MGYRENIDRLRESLDAPGLLDFLRTVARAASAPGKPADHLRARDIPLPLADGLEQVVEGFQPGDADSRVEKVIEELDVDDEDPDNEVLLALKPFNAIVFHINEGRRPTATAYSGHFDSDRGVFERLYGLEREVIRTNDSREDRRFPSKLREGRTYQIAHEGQSVPGKRLLFDLKTALFLPYLRDLADRLIAHEDFESIPKAGPFHFLVGPWMHELRQLPPGDIGENARIDVANPSPADIADFLMHHGAEPDSPDYERLERLCLEYPEVAERVAARARERPLQLLPLLWKTGKQEASDLARELFHRIPETEDPHVINRFIDRMRRIWRATPVEEQEGLQGDFDEMWAELRALEHPVVRIAVLEAMGAKGSDEHAEAVVEAIDHLPDYWVHNRLVALGTRAKAGIKRVRRLMKAADNLNRIAELGEILFSMGEEKIPKKVSDGYRTNEFMFEYYGAWAGRAIDRAIRVFDADWATKSKEFEQPKPWEKTLDVDSDETPKRFAEHVEQIPEMVESAIKAGARGAGERLTGMLEQLSRRAAKRKALDEALRVQEALGEVDEKTLRAAIRRHQEVWAEPAGELIERLPASPFKDYFTIVDIRIADGVGPAMAALVPILQGLTAGDLVYRKAVRRFAGDFYGFFRLTQRFYTGRGDDPFYRALEDGIGDLSDEQLEHALAGYREELAFWEQEPSEPEMLAELEEPRWPLMLSIAERLGEHPALVELYERTTSPELAALLWSRPRLRSALLASEAFRQRLPKIIRRESEIRDILDELEGQGEYEVIIELAHAIDPKLVMATFKPFLAAFESAGRPEDAGPLLQRILEGTQDSPEQILVLNNHAVMEVRAGRMEEAERLFDLIFSLDISRYEYDPSESDRIVAEVMGGDLDQEVANAFQIYWRMAWFNRACLFALTERPKRAVEALQEASARGHYNKAKLENESDFDALREREDFQALLETLDE